MQSAYVAWLAWQCGLALAVALPLALAVWRLSRSPVLFSHAAPVAGQPDHAAAIHQLTQPPPALPERVFTARRARYPGTRSS